MSDFLNDEPTEMTAEEKAKMEEQNKQMREKISAGLGWLKKQASDVVEKVENTETVKGIKKDVAQAKNSETAKKMTQSIKKGAENVKNSGVVKGVSEDAKNVAASEPVQKGKQVLFNLKDRISAGLKDLEKSKEQPQKDTPNYGSGHTF